MPTVALIAVSRSFSSQAAAAVHRSGRWIRGCDLGTLYAMAVLGIFGLTRLLPARDRVAFTLSASTNLDNLVSVPLRVLAASAFVVPTGRGLLILFPLVVVLALAQRRFGRLRTVCAFALGHVGATLVVAAMLVVGVEQGWVDASVAHATDVGVSYGLVCVAGLLAVALVPRWRRIYAASSLIVLSFSLVLDPDFTAVGHLVALSTGLVLAGGVLWSGRRGTGVCTSLSPCVRASRPYSPKIWGRT